MFSIFWTRRLLVITCCTILEKEQQRRFLRKSQLSSTYDQICYKSNNGLPNNPIQSDNFMALGAGANARACELEAPCSSPVEVATQQTFSILMPILKGPPGGLGCHIKTQTQLFWALVRLLSCFLMDLQYLSCARGGVGIFHPP